MGGAILSISGIKKHFGGFHVLKGIDMDLERGKVYQLIGPNGCGKTTLINVVSGLLRPDGGRVAFDGRDITGKGLFETYKAGLVRTWQIPQPFVNLTTAENFMISSPGNPGESFRTAAIGSRWRGAETRIAGEAARTMAVVGLDQKGGILSQNLSGGQQKLLELGRAMMTGAKMILMDEPIAGVNPKLAHEIFDKITAVCKDHGITFLIIEHRLDIALQYTDHVFAMDNGRIIAEGDSDSVIKHPSVVESYIGK